MTPHRTAPEARSDLLARIRDEVATGQRFLITSHARPDGDSIGAQGALALALIALGKEVRVVNRDPVPSAYRPLAGATLVEVADVVDGAFDALFVMECSDLSRPGVRGLDRYRAINIDHHLGNAHFGVINWVDSSYAACAEMTIEVIDVLGVALDRAIAEMIYLGILTDTGSFRHAGITARTFDVCRRTVEAGVDPAALARQVFDSSSMAKLRLMGALLDHMEVAAGGRLAILSVDMALLARTGATVDDLEGLINLPLQVRDVEAVVMFKQGPDGSWRASARSKGGIDVRAVAAAYGGGGHLNASGFDLPAGSPDVRAEVIARMQEAIDAWTASSSSTSLPA